MPSWRTAACCMVEVVKGGGAWRALRFFSTCMTLVSLASSSLRIWAWRASSSIENWVSFSPSK